MQGLLLISSPTMEDPNFLDAVVYIAEYNDNGALGFIINKQHDRPLNELSEFIHCPAFPLYRGGPVDTEHLFFIHRCNDLIPGGQQIADNIYLGGDFNKVIELITNGEINSTHIKIFIGYCGWDAEELETEIREGYWKIINEVATPIFD